MDAERLPFRLAVRPALIATTAPLSMWAALKGEPMIGDAIAKVVEKIIDRAWPDESKKAEAMLAVEQLRQAGAFKELDAELERSRQQTAVNQVEAASADPFVSRWRPFIGWVCGAALAWHYIGRPLADWLLLVTGATTPVPQVELGDLLVILCGMLGLGGMRTVEKLRGATK
jgi:hypothetical protein